MKVHLHHAGLILWFDFGLEIGQKSVTNQWSDQQQRAHQSNGSIDGAFFGLFEEVEDKDADTSEQTDNDFIGSKFEFFVFDTWAKNSDQNDAQQATTFNHNHGWKRGLYYGLVVGEHVEIDNETADYGFGPGNRAGLWVEIWTVGRGEGRNQVFVDETDYAGEELGEDGEDDGFFEKAGLAGGGV